MLPIEFERMYNILASFLGESKSGYQGKSIEDQYQFPCPRCVEQGGHKEAMKFNLEVTFSKGGVFHCWKCADGGDDEMKGSIAKLIKLYGNTQLYKEYKECVKSLQDSKLYSLHTAGFEAPVVSKDLYLPCGYKSFKPDKPYPKQAMDYLNGRGIDWKIIKEHRIGFTEYNEECKSTSNRIIIPSNDKYGELNYWTGRDFTNNDKRMKYMNPKIDRKDIIFNEENIQWDADITLVEGPFDHIVVPNSIPLLGKVLNTNFKLYWEIAKHAGKNKNTFVNIWLDDDAYDSVKEIYKLLNHGNLYNRIRYVSSEGGHDPSLIFQEGGRKAIIERLKNAKKIPEHEL